MKIIKFHGKSRPVREARRKKKTGSVLAIKYRCHDCGMTHESAPQLAIRHPSCGLCGSEFVTTEVVR